MCLLSTNNCLNGIQSTQRRPLLSLRMRMTTVSVWWVPLQLRSSQVRGLHAALHNNAEHFFFFFCPLALKESKVTLRLKPSSQAVNKKRELSLWVPTLPLAVKGIEIYRPPLPFPTHSEETRPHMCTEYWNNESSLPAAAMQIKLCQFLQWYKWAQSPLACIYSAWIPFGLHVHVWQLHIRKHNFSVHHHNSSTGQFKANFPAAHRRAGWTHSLAYQHNVMQGVISFFFFFSLELQQRGACKVCCSVKWKGIVKDRGRFRELLHHSHGNWYGVFTGRYTCTVRLEKFIIYQSDGRGSKIWDDISKGFVNLKLLHEFSICVDFGAPCGQSCIMFNVKYWTDVYLYKACLVFLTTQSAFTLLVTFTRSHTDDRRCYDKGPSVLANLIQTHSHTAEQLREAT